MNIKVLSGKLGDYLRKECQKRGLSQRALSINSGLSPGTVHNIIQVKYQPTLVSINCIADYLKVDRAYLWKLAGLIDDSEDLTDPGSCDPALKSHIERISRLPEDAREQMFNVCDTMFRFFEKDTV